MRYQRKNFNTCNEIEQESIRIQAISKASAEVSQLLLGEIPINEAIPITLQLIGESTKRHRVGIYQHLSLANNQGIFSLRAQWIVNEGCSDSDFELYEITIPQETQLFKSLKAGQLLHSTHPNFPVTLTQDLILRGVNNLLFIPLFVEKEMWGALILEDTLLNEVWIDSELSILHSIANNIGIAFSNERRLHEILAAKTRAERSNSMKTRFLENIQHEMRTPLNTIFGFLDLICDSEVSEEERNRFINLIRQSGERLLNTIEDVVEISRIDSGLSVVCNDILNIGELLYTLLDEFMRTEKLVSVNAIVTDELLQTDVNTDKKKIYAILRNLMQLILKGNEQGSLTIGCMVEKNHFRFVVTTTNLVIAPLLLTDLKLVSSKLTAPSIDGEPIGLKLALIKGYTELLHGEIEIEIFDSSTRFQLSIPRDKGL